MTRAQVAWRWSTARCSFARSSAADRWRSIGSPHTSRGSARSISILRQATLPAADVRIDVHNVFGTVTVLVPEGVEVRMEGGGLFSSEHVDISNSAVLDGAPVIRIRVSGMGGTVYVRTREQRGWVETMLGGGHDQGA